MKYFTQYKKTLFFAVGIAVFFVVFLWRFFSEYYWTQSIGVNLGVFWLLSLSFFVFVTGERKKESLLWLIPLGMIAVSFFLYKNPFVTTISLLVFPVLFFLFSTYDRHKNLRESIWSRYFPLVGILAIVNYLQSIFSFSKMRLMHPIPEAMSQGDRSVLSQIVTGLVIFLILALGIIIPLLSGVSPAFADIFDVFLDWVGSIFSSEILVRVIVAALVGILFMGAAWYWRRFLRNNFQLGDDKAIRSNSIATGIVLGGVLTLYLLFLGLQAQQLFLHELPIDFSETEHAVKSGFWQLFLLTIFNITFFTVIYGKGGKIVQRILFAFTGASLLLVASAAHRMYLYVSTYGLSYEKFFASYTVVFCIFVFVWLLWLAWRGNKTSVNVMRVIGFSALWMYALATWMPIEKIIFLTNLSLTQHPESRVNINELRMLGFDALSLVEERSATLIEEAVKDYRASYSPSIRNGILDVYNTDEQRDLEEAVNAQVYEEWRCWIQGHQVSARFLEKRYERYHRCVGGEREKISYGDRVQDLDTKQWYEKTIGEMMYTMQVCPMGSCVVFSRDKHAENEPWQWVDPVHGFGFSYSRENVLLVHDDKTAPQDLLEEDFSVQAFTKQKKDSGNLWVSFFPNQTKQPSKDNSHYHALLEGLKKDTHTRVRKIGQGGALRGYELIWEGQGWHGLLVEFPLGIMVIRSEISHKNVDIEKISDSEYIRLIADNEVLAQIINSMYSVREEDLVWQK